MQTDLFNTIYRVKDWDEVFENSETRKLATLRRVQLPNNFDSLKYRLTLQERDHETLLLGWDTLLKVVSRNKKSERGYTVREGEALTPQHFAAITGLRVAIFERVLKHFSQPSIGWLIPSTTHTPKPAESPGASPVGECSTHDSVSNGASVEESGKAENNKATEEPGNVPEPPGQSPGLPGSPPEEPGNVPSRTLTEGTGLDGIGGKDRERERACANSEQKTEVEPPGGFEVEPPPGFPRSEADAQAGCETIVYRSTGKPNRVCPAEFAVTEWHDVKGRGFRDRNGLPIRSWGSHLTACWRRVCDYEDRRGIGQAETSAPGKSQTLWQLQTQLNGVQTELRELESKLLKNEDGRPNIRPEDKPRWRELRNQKRDLNQQIVDFGKPKAVNPQVERKNS